MALKKNNNNNNNKPQRTIGPSDYGTFGLLVQNHMKFCRRLK